MINRRYKRILITGIATLKFEEKGKMRSIQTVIANISSGGIGLYSYNSIEVNKGVSITINFISGNGMLKTDSIEGRTICHKKIDNTYFVGLQFNEEIKAKNQPSLFEHIQRIAKAAPANAF